MAGRNLGEAFVSVLPDARLFRTQLLAKLKAALAGVTAPIPVSLDTRKALTELAALKAAIAEAASMKVRLDPGSAMQAAIMLRQIMARAGLADFLDINMPIGRIAAQLQLLRRMVNQNNLSDIVGINVDKSKVAAAVAAIGKMSESIPVNFDVGNLSQIALPAGSAIITPVVNDTVALREIAGLLRPRVLEIAVKADFTAFDAEIIDVALPGVEVLQESLASLKAKADFTILDAEIVGESKVLDTFARPRVIEITEIINRAMGGATPAITSGIGAANFTEMMHGATTTSGAFDKLNQSKDRLSKDITGNLNPAVQKSGGFLNAMGLGALGAWRWFRVLGAQIPLFGGLLRGIPLVASVSAFHLLADVILEIASVLIPAGVALAAFGVAAASTVNDIIKQEKAFFTITTALGTAFPGLSKGLQGFTDSVKPQVWTLFGEALLVINNHTGLFQKLATGAGQVLDGLGARAALALGGSGLNGLIAKGVQDLQVLGNIIGNVFGIFGNVLKVLPQYAHMLFGALQDVTGALEAITGSGAGQELLRIGLALHGAVLWGGLAVTVFWALTKVGLITWIAGVVTGFIDLVSALRAGQGAMVLFDIVASINPFTIWAVGIGLVVAGAVALVTWFMGMKSAADQLWSSIEKNVNAASTLAQANTALQQGVAAVNTQLGTTPKYIQVVTDRVHGMAQSVNTELNPAWVALKGVQGQAIGQQQVLATRMSELDKITGSAATTTADLAALNVKAGTVATDTASQYKILKEEILGLATATVQLAGYTAGPAAAAQNALTNQWLNEQLPAIQKIIQAEDNLLTVVTGGQVAFNNFQQSISGTTAKFVSPTGLADAAALAKGHLSGLSDQSLAFSNVLYTQSIPSLQKLVDGLKSQSATQQQLSTVVATGAGEILKYTGKNTEARAVIVGLINNALGPGTVSLQTLNSWVKQNSTSLGGMNAIVAQSTIKAGTLASVLQNQLNVQFHQALLESSGASAALKTYTGDIVHNTTTTSQGKTDRQRLINDLVASGMSAKQATAYVDGLNTSVGRIPAKKQIEIVMHGSGGGTINFNETTGVGKPVSGGLSFFARGGRLAGFGGGDQVPALLEPGEAVVDKQRTRKFAGVLKAMGVPGFQGGGFVSADVNAINRAQGFMGNTEASFGKAVESHWVTVLVGSLKKTLAQEVAAAKAQAAASAAAGLNNLPLGPQGPLSSSAAVAQAFAKSILFAYGWSQAQFPALQALWTQESGWNSYAVNPSSGAYGIPQALGKGHPYNLGDYQSQIRWGLAYISARYGSPAAAWAHEVAFNWYSHGGLVKDHMGLGGLIGQGYDSGGWLPPGRSVAVNNTGQYERVTPAGGSGKMTPGEQAICAKLDALIGVTGQQGHKFAGALNSVSASAGTRGSYSNRRG